MNTESLSIVVPCYNCKETLKEAVESCFEQGLNNFEIVMVDDGSTDGTRAEMQRLSQLYKKHIKLVFHEKNRGGGAARNTGINNSSGEYIYCLDSDNILANNSLGKMLAMITASKSEGIAFSERRFFYKTDKQKYKSAFNSEINKPIVFEDLFNGRSFILDNFLYKKTAYKACGGYPEHHGFDTQCFEVRFLSKGFTVSVCPDTVYYQRQGSIGNTEGTYFEREYNKGLISINTYIIYEEIIFLFSKKIREMILRYDIFSNTSLEENIEVYLKSLYKNIGHDFFDHRYKNLMKLTTDEILKVVIEDKDSYCTAVLYYLSSNNTRALDLYQDMIQQGYGTKIVYYNILRASFKKDSNATPKDIEGQVLQIISGLQPQKQNIDLNPSLIHRVYKKIKKII